MFHQTKAFLEGKIKNRPTMGVVLGSGLGGFADELTDRIEIPYAEIPGWPRSTAIGHAGKLIFGNLGAIPVVVSCPAALICMRGTPLPGSPTASGFSNCSACTRWC